MDHAADLIQGLSRFYPEVPASQIELARQVIMDHISSEKQIPINRKPLYLSVAASIAILIGIAFWYKKTEIPFISPGISLNPIWKFYRPTRESAKNHQT